MGAAAGVNLPRIKTRPMGRAGDADGSTPSDASARWFDRHAVSEGQDSGAA
jgi:hypothetical protein